MRIYLWGDVQLFAIHAPRVIPLTFREPIKKELNDMVPQGATAPTGDNPSPWCHPQVAVGVHIITDLSKLNSQVSPPAHPSSTFFTAI